MHGIKKWLSIMLLASVVGLGTPAAVRAEGSTETPALRAEVSVEAGNISVEGSTETPSFLTVVAVYISAVL